MRLSLIFVLFVTSLPSVTPIAAITVFELGAKITEIAKTMLEIFSSVNDHADLIDTEETRREKLVISKLDEINVRLIDIDEQLHGIGRDVNMIVEMLKSLPGTIQSELKLHDIRQLQVLLETYYEESEKFVRDFDEYEKSTITAFVDGVVSTKSNSVPFLMELLYRHVSSPDFLQLFYKRFQAKQTNNYFCNGCQSLPEVFQDFLNEMIMLNTKSYILTLGAYMIKKSYGLGNFTKEIQETNRDFQKRTNGLIKSIKPYMAQASAELWRCDPQKHKEGETFVEITNFLHGYVINKANIDPNGRCRDECDVYTYTKTRKCNGNAWCEKQPGCPTVLNCQYVDSSMKVCSKTMHEDNRRYQYIETGSGKTLGKKDNCPNDKVTSFSTYIYWLIYRCSYCFCICDEGPKYFSDRYINLRQTLSNVTDNRVVTGVRFVKRNKVIHLQIQEGKLLPFGQIDLDNVGWVPVEDYKITDKNVHDGVDYHTLSWSKRGFDLADIKAKDGYVVTGVKFRQVGTRLHLEVHTTPFNFTTGQLKPQRGFYQEDPDFRFKHKFGKPLKLDKPDVPIEAKSPSTVFTTGKYVQFVNSDIEKDAAQTTVPFFDAQPVASSKPVPLAGIGVFHKGLKGYGGFIAPRIFTYNVTKHLEPMFPPDNDRLRKDRLRKN